MRCDNPGRTSGHPRTVVPAQETATKLDNIGARISVYTSTVILANARIQVVLFAEGHL